MRNVGLVLFALALGCGGRRSLTAADAAGADATTTDAGTTTTDVPPESGPPDLGPGVLVEATQPPTVVADPGIVDWETPLGESPVGWDLCPEAAGQTARGTSCAACTHPPLEAAFLVYDGTTAARTPELNGQNAAIFFAEQRTIAGPVGLWFEVSLQEGDAADATLTFFPAPCQLESPIGPYQLGPILSERGRWRSACVPFPAPLATYGLGFRFDSAAKLGLAALHLGPPCPGQPGTAPAPTLAEICSKLERDYASALSRAKRCSFDGPTRCLAAVRLSLRCGCETFVHDDRALNVLAARWKAVGCDDDTSGGCVTGCRVESPTDCVASDDGSRRCEER
jgi:hypothetical protein